MACQSVKYIMWLCGRVNDRGPDGRTANERKDNFAGSYKQMKGERGINI